VYKRVVLAVKKARLLAVALAAGALANFSTASFATSTLSGTFTITASPSATSRSGTYTTPQGDTGTFLLEQLSATGYTSPPTFTDGTNGIMVSNGQVIAGGDTFQYRLTLTPNPGQAQSLIVELGQATYGTVFNTEPARMTFNYSGSAGPSSGALVVNPNVAMHPTNGTAITGSQPQIRVYTGTPTPIVKNTTPAASYPPMAVGTSIPSGSSAQNYGVATVDTQYRIDFQNTNVITFTYTGNMRDIAAGTIGETYNETISFGVRSNPAKVKFRKQSIGGTGTFSFSAQSNLSALPPAINTALANPGPAAPVQLTATSFMTTTTLTETPAAGFVLTGFSCTDDASSITGNSGSFGTFFGNVVAIPAENIRAGADITCTIVNSVAAPALTITKTPSVPSVSAAGTVITYAIVVTNSGNTTLTGINVADPLVALTCTTSGTAMVATLAAGASENCSAQYTVTQANLDSGGTAINNTVTATTVFAGNPVSANANAAVTLIRNPNLVLAKSANTAGPVNVNDVITYTYLVRNAGNVTINGINVNDIHNGTGTPPVPGNELIETDVAPLNDSSDGAANGSWDVLRPGDTIKFTASYTVTQQDIDTLY
jgi:uncharacterized repeat protein (TIGR01451 family)